MKSKYFNDDDLENMAPGLSEVKKENSFKVPEDYFVGLPTSILQKIEALPDLEKLNKANPYQVPDGYFDSIPSAVQQRIIEDRRRYAAQVNHVVRVATIHIDGRQRTRVGRNNGDIRAIAQHLNLAGSRGVFANGDAVTRRRANRQLRADHQSRHCQ